MLNSAGGPCRLSYRGRTRPVRCRQGLGDGGLQHALRLRDPVALRIIDTETGEHLDDLRVLGELGDSLLAGEMPDLVDRADHFAVDRIAQDLAHEAAVDLQVIDREVL